MTRIRKLRQTLGRKGSTILAAAGVAGALAWGAAAQDEAGGDALTELQQIYESEQRALDGELHQIVQSLRFDFPARREALIAWQKQNSGRLAAQAQLAAELDELAPVRLQRWSDDPEVAAGREAMLGAMGEDERVVRDEIGRIGRAVEEIRYGDGSADERRARLAELHGRERENLQAMQSFMHDRAVERRKADEREGRLPRAPDGYPQQEPDSPYHSAMVAAHAKVVQAWSAAEAAGARPLTPQERHQVRKAVLAGEQERIVPAMEAQREAVLEQMIEQHQKSWELAAPEDPPQ